MDDLRALGVAGEDQGRGEQTVRVWFMRAALFLSFSILF
jgi:hypothetical protein